MSLQRLVLPTHLLILLLCSSLSFAQDKDRVFPTKGGAAATGKIIERTKDKVVIENIKGTPQNYATNEILRLVFDGEPPQLSRAKDNIVQAQYDQAKDELSKVVVDTLKSEDMKEEYLFYKTYLSGAMALRGQGDPSEASKALLTWAGKYRTSHNFYAASEMLGNLAIASGTPDQAAKFFGAFASAPFVDYKLKGSFLQGRALMLLKQNAEAKAKFAIVTQAKVSDPPSLKLQKLATIATFKCDAADGKSEQAILALEKMVDEGDSTDAELFADLYNAIGSIHQSQNNHYEAVLSFLKTDLLYASQAEAHAEALYNLIQLWAKVGEPLQSTDAKSRLAKLYPTSPWVKK
jgi:tetratricopeptide (TPR) repeat protein